MVTSSNSRPFPPPAEWDVYVIGDRDLAGGLSHLEIAQAAFEGGARAFQLRDKSGAPDDELLPEAAEIALLARERGTAFIVNDRVALAARCGASGVHVGRGDVCPRDVRQGLGPQAIIGWSNHSPAQAEEALALTSDAAVRLDMISYGPVFGTTTKKDAKPIAGVDSLRPLLSRMSAPLGAIGGINLSNIARVAEAGFGIAAVISAAMDPDPKEITRKTRELRAVFLEARAQAREAANALGR